MKTRLVGQNRWWLAGLLALALWAGCKREDTDSPTMALFAPGDGFSILADSTFTISGRANDETGLSSITALLTDVTTDAVVSSQTVTISGLENRFSFEMRAGNRYTTTGVYALKVTAFDLAGNPGSAFGTISIQALPLGYRGAVWAGDQAALGYGLYYLDTAGQVVPGPFGLPSLRALLVDSRNGVAVCAQSVPGSLRAFDLPELLPVFTQDLNTGTNPSYSSLSMNASRYFAGLAVPDYLRAIHFDGTQAAGWEQCLHPVTAVLAQGERVYAGLQGFVGLPLKLDAYSAATGELQATLPLDWAVDGIASLDGDQLLVWGNEAGEGRVIVVDAAGMTAGPTLDVGAPLVAAATAGGRAWLLTDAGLHEFFPASTTMSGQLTAGSYTAIAVDPTRTRLFLGGDGVVEERTGAGALVTSHLGVFGVVRYIGVAYNR